MGYREILAALADETRRGILQELRRGRRSAGELAEALGVSPQALSYHLAKLKKAELVRETRKGNFIYYEPDLTVLDENKAERHIRGGLATKEKFAHMKGRT